MTTYFVCDVETSSLQFFDGDLLTLGIAVVKDQHGGHGLEVTKLGLFHHTHPDVANWDPDTRAWWESRKDENPRAYQALFGAPHSQFSPAAFADDVRAFLDAHEPDPTERIFVSSPIGFDWPWVMTKLRDVSLFAQRHIDLHSLCAGLDPHMDLKGTRTSKLRDVGSAHTAEGDAYQAAQELVTLLEMREARAADENASTG